MCFWIQYREMGNGEIEEMDNIVKEDMIAFSSF